MSCGGCRNACRRCRSGEGWNCRGRPGRPVRGHFCPPRARARVETRSGSRATSTAGRCSWLRQIALAGGHVTIAHRIEVVDLPTPRFETGLSLAEGHALESSMLPAHGCAAVRLPTSETISRWAARPRHGQKAAAPGRVQRDESGEGHHPGGTLHLVSLMVPETTLTWCLSPPDAQLRPRRDSSR